MCFLDVVNTCPDNFGIQLECLWPGIEEGVKRDYLGGVCIVIVGGGRESRVREHNKQRIESWFAANYNGKQTGMSEPGWSIMFIFSFKKWPHYFYSMTGFPMIPLKVDLTFGELQGKFGCSMALNFYSCRNSHAAWHVAVWWRDPRSWLSVKDAHVKWGDRLWLSVGRTPCSFHPDISFLEEGADHFAGSCI